MKRKPAATVAVGPSPYEAFRELVYMDDTAGVHSAAAFLGIKVGTLYNKADADGDSKAQPTLRDVVQLTHFRGDFRVLDALNELFGRAAYDVGRFATTSDVELLALMCKFGAENGEFHKMLLGALEDGRFTADEMASVRAEAFDVVSALMTLLSRLEQIVEPEDGRHG